MLLGKKYSFTIVTWTDEEEYPPQDFKRLVCERIDATGEELEELFSMPAYEFEEFRSLVMRTANYLK